MSIATIWKPETFQGRRKTRRYFEGWYFKLISADRKTVLAVIPGIALGEQRPDAHAFVQVIDAVRGKTAYIRFPLEAFFAEKNAFDVRIGNNSFNDAGIEIDLDGDGIALSGRLHFSAIDKYPRSLFHPGIMGPFSFVPGMECYHGVVNLSHTISGMLTLNGVSIDMNGGEGYIEKDWGKSFPDAWIWMQANHFQEHGASFLFSVARIPWLGAQFTGLISFLKTKDGFYRFATYNGSRIESLKLTGDTLRARLKGAAHTLEFVAAYAKGGILKAPKNGMMHREIEESITARIELTLRNKSGETSFRDVSQFVGMELSNAAIFEV